MKRHIFALYSLYITALLLASCTTVQPPQRPVAYIYPSLVPMSDIQACRPTKLDEAAVRKLLEKSRTLSVLENAGLHQSEISILVRGIAKHGYAELDARRSKSKISWLTVSCYDGTAVIRAVFRSRPDDFSRFGISTAKMVKSHERGYYGEPKTVLSAAKDNVILRSVKSPKSSVWEVYVTLKL